MLNDKEDELCTWRRLNFPCGGRHYVGRHGGTHLLQRRKLKQEMDDRKLPLMGSWGLCVCGPNDQLHHSGHRFQRPPGRRHDSRHSAGTLCRLSHHGLRPDGAGIVLRRRRLLALGCNIFNLGFFPCFIAYPFIYKRLVGERPTQGRILLGAMAAAILSLQMGRLGWCWKPGSRYFGVALRHLRFLDFEP